MGLIRSSSRLISSIKNTVGREISLPTFFVGRSLRFPVHFSLAQRKRTKRNIHPHQTSPYIGRLKKFLAETDEKFYVLVSRDFAMIFFIGYRAEKSFVLLFFCLKKDCYYVTLSLNRYSVFLSLFCLCPISLGEDINFVGRYINI